MTRHARAAVLCAVMAGVVSPTALPRAQAQTNSSTKVAAGPTIRLRKGTMLKLETLEALDPAAARAGDLVPLRFTRALYVEGVTLIPTGAVVNGTITKVTPVSQHCLTGEVFWQLSEITLPDSSSVKTRVRYKAWRGDVRDTVTRTQDTMTSGDQVGRLIEETLALPILPPLLAVEGVKSLARKSSHGCTARSRNKPSHAHSTVLVEVLEDREVRY